jgi:tetratricopeptide (TPR) repeat protein
MSDELGRLEAADPSRFEPIANRIRPLLALQITDMAKELVNARIRLRELGVYRLAPIKHLGDTGLAPLEDRPVGEFELLKELVAVTVTERDEARTALEETNRSRDLLQKMLAERDGALAEMSQRIEALRGELTAVQAELAKRDEALSDAQAALSDQRAVTEAVQTERAELGNALAAVQAELAKRDEALSDAQAALSDQIVVTEVAETEKAELRATLAVTRDVAGAALAALQIELVTPSTHRRSDLLLRGGSKRLWRRHLPLLMRKRTMLSVMSLADRARDAGQWELAAGYYRAALRRKPDNSAIWVRYGHVLKESGHLAEAEWAYQVGVAYDQSVADSHLQLGHALKLQGKREEALAAYMRAFALDPSLEGARLELAKLGWIEAHFASGAAFLTSTCRPARPLPA